MRGKKRFIQLTDEQRQVLQRGYSSGRSAKFARRCQIILLSDKRKEIKEISELLDLSRQAITIWFDRYEQLGIEGLHRQEGGGRPPIFKFENVAEVARIKAIVSEHPQQLKQAIPVIEEELQRSFSQETLKRFLKKRLVVQAPPRRNRQTTHRRRSSPRARDYRDANCPRRGRPARSVLWG